MATQVSIVQGKNSFLDAMQQSLANLGTQAAAGMQKSEDRTMQASAYKAQELKTYLDSIAKEAGGSAFDPNLRGGAQNTEMIGTLIAMTEGALGRAMTDAERASVYDRYRFSVPASSESQNKYFMKLGMFPEEAQAAAPAPAATKPTVDTARNVAATTPSAAAQAAAQSGVQRGLAYNKGQEWLMSATPQALTDLGFLKPETAPSGFAIPGVGASTAGTHSTGRYMLRDAQGNDLGTYKDVNEALKAFHTAIGTSPEGAQATYDQLVSQYGDRLTQYGVLRTSQTGYSGMPVPKQEGMQANGTVSRAQHERATGDKHYPASVGINEGIVNARAMQTPGVADIVMELNRRFPANVAASRGTYADGYTPATGPTQSVSAGPPPVQGYPAQVQLDEGGPVSQRSANDMPQVRAALDESAAETAEMSQTSIEVLKDRGVVSNPPPSTPKAAELWDRVRQHSADVQAKYQINYANPDPREKAILARELKIEQGLVRAAMAADTDRKDWARQQQARIVKYLKTASDEELALAFGPTVAQARQNAKGRELEQSAQELQWAIANLDNDTNQKAVTMLAAQMVPSMMSFYSQFAGKDKEGKATWNSSAAAEATAQVGYPKQVLDIMSLVFGGTGGVANPTVDRNYKTWFLAKPESKWGFQWVDQAQAAQTSPQVGAEASAFLGGQ